MKPIFDFFRNHSILPVGLLLYIFSQSFILLDINHDGVIRNISVTHLITYVVFSSGLVWAIVMSTKSKYSFIRNISFSLFIFVFFWLFLELICWGINKSKIIDFKSPTNALLFVDGNLEKVNTKPFWGDFNATFGKWRLPNDSLTKNRCDDNLLLFYKTNSTGARDQERSLKNTTNKRRVIFIGDSFVEGIMVNTADRCSDILEKSTHNEHLNFGINGTSPINYYLTYKSLAKKFEHDVVIIGVLPANDFEDYSEGDEASLINFPIYRPYWKSAKSGYELKYSLSSVNQAYGSLAIYNQPLKIFKTKDSIYQSLSFGQKLKTEFLSNSYMLGLMGEIIRKKSVNKSDQTSMFYSYPKNKWAIFSYSLKKLIQEAGGKQIIILTIPTLKDIQLFHRNRQNLLSTQMSKFCKVNNVNYIDLLPILSSVANPDQLYVECDGHWNEKGEKFVANFLLKHPIYQKSVLF